MPAPVFDTRGRAGAGWSRARRLRGFAVCCGFWGVLELAAAPVRADDAPVSPSVQDDAAKEEMHKRPLPNYDGREPEPVFAAEKAMWIPRGILFPVHVALRLTLEKPILATVELVERYRVQYWLKWLLIWKDGKIGLLPTAFYQFGLDPSLGFLFFMEDVIMQDHTMVLEAGFWFDDWREIRFDNRWKIRPEGTVLALRVNHVGRPDQVYFGVGPATKSSDRSYYRLDSLETAVRLRGLLPDLHRFRGVLSWRRAELDPGQRPSVETKHQLEENRALLGFGEYQLVKARVHLDIDSREKTRFRTSGSGGRVELFGSYGIDPMDTGLQVLTWGTEVSGFLDVTGHNHVLGVRGCVEFAEQVGGRSIPVTELITLGGLERMRGFLPGRFHGRSAFVATAQYRYPIWTYIDADLFVSFGNTFDGHLDGFELRQLHMTSGFAVRSNHSRQTSFDFLIGFGTNRLDSHPVRIESVHLAVGVNQGF